MNISPDKSPALLEVAKRVMEDRKRQVEKKELAEKSLRSFAEQAWHVVEPSTPFIGGWNLDALCEHLEGVSAGHIRNLAINVPPRTAKPVWEQEPVLEKTKGRIALAEVDLGDEVLTHRGRFRKVLEIHDQGELPLVAVRTYSGRTVRTAEDHPFLTPRGWVEAGALTEQDVVASVHATETCGTNTVTPEEARLLGYLIGDGSVQYNQCGVTNEDEGVLSDVEHCARSLGFYTRRRVKKGCVSSIVIITPKPPGSSWSIKRDGAHIVWGWLEKHGLKGKNSYNKRVPVAITSATNELIAEFVGAYWSCDGHINSRGRRHENGGRKDCQIGCDSVCEGLARDIQHLLTRVGVYSSVRRRTAQLKTRKQGDLYVSWRTMIGTLDHGSKFAAIVNLRHKKKTRLLEYVRSGFDKILNEDPVVEVKPDGTGRCLCLTVEEDSSFTAGDIAVHNSLFVSVFWPAWHWLRKPETRWLFSAYTSKLSLRDSMKCRRVIDSPWYQANWRERFQLIGDQNTKENYENDKTGQRIATSVSGIGVGAGGDVICTDDANNTEEIESDVMRQGVLDWWDHTMSTRGNDPKTVARVVIQQRLHEQDLTGHVLAQGGYTHLMLPMRFEKDRRCVTFFGGKTWQDPRQKEGDLLWPERFGDKEIAELEKRLGSYMSAGQLQQRPSPQGGGMLKTHWWRYWQPRGANLDPVPVKMPDGTVKQVDAIEQPEKFDTVLQSWDLSFKDEKTSDFVVGGVLASKGANRFVLDLVRDRMDLPKTMLAVRRMSALHPNAHTKLVEDKANGPAVMQSLHNKIGGFIPVNPIGGKLSRAAAASPMLESGNWYLPHPALFTWVEGFINECSGFPKAQYDDQVDMWSQGAARLINSAAVEDEDDAERLRAKGYKDAGWTA